MAEAVQLLLEQAERERDAALLLVRQAEARVAQAQAQRRDLDDYQRDFDARWLAQFQAEGGSVQLLQAQAQFGQRLSEAIGQQSGQITLLEGRLQLARQQLQEKELRVASVRKLLERRQAEALLRANRAEQKLNDEIGAQRHRAAR